MNRPVLTLAVAAAATAVVAGGAVLALAQADPAAPPEPAGPPQPGASCPAAFDGALTALPKQAGDPPNQKNLLECTDGQWSGFGGEYPSSERWLSTDAELVLRGQGMRNPEMMSGPWTGSPQSPESNCAATYTEVVSGKVAGARTVTGDPGQPLQFEAPPNLLTVTLSGYCLWELS